MTNAKLKIMIEINQGEILKDNKAVILDEFLDSDWMNKVIKTDEEIKDKDEKDGDIHITWELHEEVVLIFVLLQKLFLFLIIFLILHTLFQSKTYFFL